MGDQKTTNESTKDGKQTGGSTSDAGDKFEPITSQDELNRIIGERVKRAKPSDYDEVKAKAAELDKLKEASKSEQQKLEDRITKAEQAAAESKLEAMRFRVATKHGISDEDADLFLTGTDEDTLNKQAERLSDRTPRPAPHVRREGATHTAVEDPKRQFLSELRGG